MREVLRSARICEMIAKELDYPKNFMSKDLRMFNNLNYIATVSLILKQPQVLVEMFYVQRHKNKFAYLFDITYVIEMINILLWKCNAEKSWHKKCIIYNDIFFHEKTFISSSIIIDYILQIGERSYFQSRFWYLIILICKFSNIFLSSKEIFQLSR